MLNRVRRSIERSKTNRTSIGIDEIDSTQSGENRSCGGQKGRPRRSQAYEERKERGEDEVTRRETESDAESQLGQKQHGDLKRYLVKI